MTEPVTRWLPASLYLTAVAAFFVTMCLRGGMSLALALLSGLVVDALLVINWWVTA